MTQTFDEIQRLADEGLTACQIEVGNSYLTGRDPEGNPCEVNFLKARDWLERAHAKGASTATYMLGTIYENGTGVKVDTRKAIELYEAAASQGAFLPCLALARIFAQGKKGVPASTKDAALWYQRVLDAEDEVDEKNAMEEARRFLSQAAGA